MHHSSKDSPAIQPVVIIGAARSGTNMLRNLLVQVPDVGSWPFDETNYIWQCPLADQHHDELGAAHADLRTSSRVHRAFRKLADREQCRWVIEKSCVNSLRVDYVDAILPDAKFLFLLRDGRDVVLSSLKKWSDPRDPPQLMKRLSYLPLRDMANFGSQFLARRAQRTLSRKKIPLNQPSSWGPRFRGIEQALATHSTEEVCALQWQQSVEQAADALQSLSSNRFTTIQYEDFVNQPAENFRRILDFLKIDIDDTLQNRIVSEVFSASAGRWRTKMSAEQCSRIESLIGETLTSYGYPLSISTRSEKVA